MTYFAHTAKDERGKALPLASGKWQPLAVHLRNVAELAKEFASPFNLSVEAEWAGLLHDLGKYARRFQARLSDPAIHGVNHWVAGARRAADSQAWFASYAVDGHHTGLPKCGELRESLLRMDDAALRRELTGCAESLSELTVRFDADGLTLPPPPSPPGKDHFADALQTRMTFSCLVDADFLDTEAHFDAAAAVERAVPALEADSALQLLLDHLRMLPTKGSVNDLRRGLLTRCLEMAEGARGLFTLTAPTGSGKTLSSLAFALKHIAHHNARLPIGDPRRLRRIIVVIPYTSIIEQTARVFRDIFEPAFGPHYVLEHHSAVTPRVSPSDATTDAEEERLRRARLAAENWSAPLVVTTSVQFFESLFGDRPSDCRKIHNVPRSVVIFDEVQTLPPRLVPSLLSAVGLLTRPPYGMTAVFTTATQPAFESAKDALPYGWNPMPIEVDRNAMADTLRRTSIHLPKSGERISWSALAEELCAHEQALCVVNTTKDARDLFRLLPAPNRFHLSARLCPAHRQERLALIRAYLHEHRACRLISTQLIEAGVDVDFPIAFRALGPLDSIIQTAGRCNREGHHAEPGPVIIFRPESGGMPPGAYRTAAAKTEEYLARHPDAQARLHRPDFYAAYFTELYALVGRESTREDPVFEASEGFDFPLAAARCRLVGEETRSVLVKWGEGEALINKLRYENHLSREEWRQVQRFSINLHQGEFLKAQGYGFISEASDGVWFWNSHYDEDLGACHVEGDDDFCA